MIGSSVLGAIIFWISNSMYSIALDVLIKILEKLSTLEPKIDPYYTHHKLSNEPNNVQNRWKMSEICDNMHIYLVFSS